MAHSTELTAERPQSSRDPLNLKDKALFRQQGLIGGEWVSADSGGTLAVNNPASGDKLGVIPNMGSAETNARSPPLPRRCRPGPPRPRRSGRESCADGSISWSRTRRTSPPS